MIMQNSFKIYSLQSRPAVLNGFQVHSKNLFSSALTDNISFYGYSAEEVFANIEMGGLNSRIKKKFYHSEVDPGKLYRGAKPKEKHLHELKNLNIKTIICLKPLKEHKLEQYKKMLEHENFKLEYLPVDSSKGPTKKDIQRFFDIVNQPNNQPVFLHCHYGFDRTGLFVALYRVAENNFTQQMAFEEMKRFGYSQKMYPEYKRIFYDHSQKRLNVLT